MCFRKFGPKLCQTLHRWEYHYNIVEQFKQLHIVTGWHREMTYTSMPRVELSVHSPVDETMSPTQKQNTMSDKYRRPTSRAKDVIVDCRRSRWSRRSDTGDYKGSLLENKLAGCDAIWQRQNGVHRSVWTLWMPIRLLVCLGGYSKQSICLLTSDVHNNSIECVVKTA